VALDTEVEDEVGVWLRVLACDIAASFAFGSLTPLRLGLAQLPYNDYFEYFGPDFRLHINPSNMDNQNSPEYLEKCKMQLIENLRNCAHAPGVQQMDLVDIAGPEELDEEADNPDERNPERLADRRIECDEELSASEDETGGRQDNQSFKAKQFRKTAADAGPALAGGAEAPGTEDGEAVLAADGAEAAVAAEGGETAVAAEGGAAAMDTGANSPLAAGEEATTTVAPVPQEAAADEAVQAETQTVVAATVAHGEGETAGEAAPVVAQEEAPAPLVADDAVFEAPSVAAPAEGGAPAEAATATVAPAEQGASAEPLAGSSAMDTGAD